MRGFSLIELSIVLVILGLLTGGILSGQALIRAAEIRSVSTDISRYRAAIYTFRDKYMGVPGDITNATAFWGAKHADLATCLTAPVDGTKTCNGNGSGNYNYASILLQREGFLAWQHLANAGLIEGTYSGIQGPAGALDAVIGVNVPRSRVSQGGYTLTYAPTFSGHSSWFDGSFETDVISFGADPDPTYQYQTNSAILKPEEAWNIDTKSDDGSPVTGIIVASKKDSAARPNCTTANDKTALYNVSDSGIWCYLNISMNNPYRAL